MIKLYFAFGLIMFTSVAFGVSCPSPSVQLSVADSQTIAALDTTGHCPPGYEMYDSPSHISAYFSGTLLSDAPTLCGIDEYMNDGVCTPYHQDRCDNGYLMVTNITSSVGALDNTNHCPPGYAVTTIPSWIYFIPTGTIVGSGVTLCGDGEYMNDGVCTQYDNTKCPNGWYNYTTANPDTFMPTASDTCATNYVRGDDSIDCNYKDTDDTMCGAFCNTGEKVTWGGVCAPLCRAGITEMHVGSFTFPVYAQKTTEHALHVRPIGSDDVCYVNMTSGVGTEALHLPASDGTIYHTTQ